jgi:hypothetical protein
VSVEGDE